MRFSVAGLSWNPIAEYDPDLCTAGASAASKKGEHLYHGGEDSTNLYFLISGILRGFTVSAGGKEYTECILHKYGHAHIGMIGMGVEKEFKLNKNLEALTEVDVIYFDVRPIMKELPNSIEFLRVYVKKLEESYAQMWEAREIMRESAQARYTWFQKTYPNLQNVMQMKDVATFLGITPVTLSRIRAKENSSVKRTAQHEAGYSVSESSGFLLSDLSADGKQPEI